MPIAPRPLLTADNRLLNLITIAFLVGCVAVMGWSPFGYWPLSLGAYVVLAALLRRASRPLDGLFIGFAFGFGLHIIGSSWVYEALHREAGQSGAFAAAATIAFCSYLAIFTALPSAILTWLGASRGIQDIENFRNSGAWRLTQVALFAALMTLGEWGRSQLFNGFTSLSLGCALIDTPLRGYAPVFGAYGVSTVGFLMAALVVFAVSGLASRPRQTALGILAGSGLTAVGMFFSLVDWTHPFGEPLTYRLIQANVIQTRKFDPAFIPNEINAYEKAITQAPADLVATPETALPVFLNQIPPGVMQRLKAFSRTTNSHVLIGVATMDAAARGFNSAIDVAPGRDFIQRIDKIDLMPFGEYTPWGFNWFTKALAIPLKDLSAGAEGQRPFDVNGQKVGVMICQEDLLGRAALRWMPSATLLLDITNLAWFDGTLAIGQSIQIARMRALEVGRPILRVANTGVTAAIDARGNVLKALPIGTRAVLSGKVQPVDNLTPFDRWGELPLVAALIVISAVLTTRHAIFRWMQSRHNVKSPHF